VKDQFCAWEERALPLIEDDHKPRDSGMGEEAMVLMPEVDLSKVVKLSTAENGRTPYFKFMSFT
jgi:hypothetical protein